MHTACNEIVEDIEDLVSSKAFPPINRYNRGQNIVTRIVKKKYQNITEDDFKYKCDSIIPGTQVIYIKTWGCSHNISDSEYMAGQLQSYGYKLTGKSSIITVILNLVFLYYKEIKFVLVLHSYLKMIKRLQIYGY